ncbi:hypothetical protein NP233_g5397 [Leucocoprinus birnbaumii]|uniref:Uncharacterized protein n=1 Tax=Leucocoprinus birnbaumii TaxID=56174 RepID=A0AAD5YUN3_9AGAR|nr:hypothetical protein NP233_g5397 [Leucocoprinus birnbaumii]
MVTAVGKLEGSNQYFSIITMLIASFALEFIWMTINIATGFSNDIQTVSVNMASGDLAPSIQIIAYLLIVYRVSTGRAWKQDTEEKLTSLQWNQDASELHS